MKQGKELAINFIATAIAFITNAAINFWLSKYIVSTVNEEAYGFIQFANTFVTYFTIITIAINSMASRFIAVEYYKGDKKEASNYYKSTLIANCVIILLSAPIIIFTVCNIEKIMNITPSLVPDIKMLLIFLIGNLYLGLITTNLSVSYYIRNKLYIQSVINTISYILKAVILLVAYTFLPPYVSIFGIATFIATTFIQILSIYYKKKLIPEVSLKNGKFRFKDLKILISSGIWNFVTRVGDTLSSGLDLLISNLFIGPSEMGILAIVKTIPNLISSALNSLVNIFIPNMTKLYAEQKKEEFIKYIKISMKLTGIFLNIPILCVIVLGNVLFKLWFPTQDATLLHILSIISISPWIIIGPVSIMHNIFTVVNKLKVNSILICTTGVLNVLIVYLLLKNTSLALFAVVAVSCILSILRNLLYTLPFGAKAIGVKWYAFFPEIGRSLLATAVSTCICYGIKLLINPNSWLTLIGCGICVCILGLIINIVVILSKEQKEYAYNIVKMRLINKNFQKNEEKGSIE